MLNSNLAIRTKKAIHRHAKRGVVVEFLSFTRPNPLIEVNVTVKNLATVYDSQHY